MTPELNAFVKSLHPSSRVGGWGTAKVMGHKVDAVVIINLYGQKIVWGFFSVDSRKNKFVGKIANNANTEGVDFRWSDDYLDSPALRRFNRQWLDGLSYPNMSHKLQ